MHAITIGNGEWRVSRQRKKTCTVPSRTDTRDTYDFRRTCDIRCSRPFGGHRSNFFEDSIRDITLLSYFFTCVVNSFEFRSLTLIITVTVCNGGSNPQCIRMVVCFRWSTVLKSSSLTSLQSRNDVADLCPTLPFVPHFSCSLSPIHLPNTPFPSCQTTHTYRCCNHEAALLVLGREGEQTPTPPPKPNNYSHKSLPSDHRPRALNATRLPPPRERLRPLLAHLPPQIRQTRAPRAARDRLRLPRPPHVLRAHHSRRPLGFHRAPAKVPAHPPRHRRQPGGHRPCD